MSGCDKAELQRMASAVLFLIAALFDPQPISACQVPGQRLQSLIQADWEYQKRHSPALAEVAGDRRWIDRWPDLSPTAVRKREDHDRATLEHLRVIRRDIRSESDRLTYDLFERELQARLEEFRVGLFRTPFRELVWGPSALRLMDYVRSETAPASLTEYEQRVQKLKSLPDYINQQISLLRRAKQERMVPGKELVVSALGDVGEEIKAGTG